VEHVASIQAGSSACCLLHAGFFLGLLFNSEDGRDMFLHNISWLSADYTMLVVEGGTLHRVCFTIIFCYFRFIEIKLSTSMHVKIVSGVSTVVVLVLIIITTTNNIIIISIFVWWDVSQFSAKYFWCIQCQKNKLSVSILKISCNSLLDCKILMSCNVWILLLGFISYEN
jgi:hypothetical protein